jgi:hypothetical protein
MAAIQKLWVGATESGKSTELDPDLHQRLRNRSIHALQFFTFHQSTPSPVVSSEMRTAFFLCAPTDHPFLILSSTGICNALDVRMPDSTFAGFLKKLPVFPEEFVAGAKLMVAGLRDKGMLRDISFTDVFQELRSRPLSEPEMTACLNWWIDVFKQGKHPNLPNLRTELLSAAVLITGVAPPGNTLALSTIRTFLKPHPPDIPTDGIPTDGPLPADLLPLAVGENLDTKSLPLAFPWRELTTTDWIRHISDPSVCSQNAEFDINSSPPWAEKVLQVLARVWKSLPKRSQGEIVEALKNRTWIPTSSGMQTSEQSYLSNVAIIFHDLPVVTLPSSSPIEAQMEEALEALGVRKHVDLQVLFDRFVGGALISLVKKITHCAFRMVKTGDWTTADLTKYLVSVQSTLKPTEIEWLRLAAAFPKEREETDPVPAPDQEKISRHRASDLYEPLEIFRQLGLPLIDWGTQHEWEASSKEGQFISECREDDLILTFRSKIPL